MRDKHGLIKSKKGTKFGKFVKGKGFGKNICNHVISRYIMKGEMTLRNSLTNEMKININVLGASMKSRIRRETNSTLIITKSEGMLEGIETIGENSRRSF